MSKKQKTWVAALGGVLLIVLGTVAYWIWSAGFIATDDAVLTANQVAVSSKYPGRLATLAVRAGSRVRKGDTIATLETAELELQVAGAEAAYRALEAKFRAMAEGARAPEIAAAEAAREAAATAAALAQSELERHTVLFQNGAVAADALDRARSANEAAQARLNQAENQLALVRGGLKKAELRAAAFEADRAKSQWDLLRTQLAAAVIAAPVTGTVATQNVHPGEYVQPGQSLVYVTDESDIWVTAYLEETKLQPVRIGMPVEVHFDFGDVDVMGKVRMIGNTAASVFSMFPPDRAAGNFTKVSQRVPVEIKLDGSAARLPGTSAEVKFLLR